MRPRPHPFIIVVFVGALAGLLFASVSTYDFAMHLDRQMHDVHCSFVPGLSGPERGDSGCQVTLTSPYSSVFRQSLWGGVPISLPAMAVFAFLMFFAVEVTMSGRQRDPRTAAFLLAATALPALTSVVMAYLSLVKLDAVCKLCIGIYLASFAALVGGIGVFLAARKNAADAGSLPRATARPSRDEGEQDGDAEPAWVSGKEPAAAKPRPIEPVGRPTPPQPPPAPMSYLAGAFAVGIVFVVGPVLAYAVAAPDHGQFAGQCGTLSKPNDDYGVMVALDPHPGKPPAIELLDPLCPACRGFEQRLHASGLDAEMDRKALLFPLDDTCNWMIDDAVHPGACAVSEAMLCAGERSRLVLEWAFANQKQIRTAAKADPKAAAEMVKQRFPDLASCVGSAGVRSKLNRSLRWAVANQLTVLTPQLFVGGYKLCEEDTDLGLDYSLSRLLAAYREGRLTAVAPAAAAAVPAEPAEAAPAPAPEPTEQPAAETPRPAEPAPAAETPPAKAAPAEGAPGGETPPAKAPPAADSPAQPGDEPDEVEPPEDKPEAKPPEQPEGSGEETP